LQSLKLFEIEYKLRLVQKTSNLNKAHPMRDTIGASTWESVYNVQSNNNAFERVHVFQVTV